MKHQPYSNFIRPALLLAAALTISLAAPNPAHAGCSQEVRLDKAGGSMERIPVLAQDGTETCYAYAAAQLQDAYRHRVVRDQAARGKIPPQVASAQLNHITSPLVVAVNTAYAAKEESVDTGEILGAMNAINQGGSCSHQTIGDRFGAYDPKQFLIQLKGYFDQMQRRRPGAPIARPPSPLDCCIDSNDPSAALSRRSLEEYLKATNYVGFLKKVFDGACRKSSTSVPPSDYRIYRGFGEPNIRKRLANFSAVLGGLQSRTDLPIAINYCADLLYNRGVVGITSEGKWDCKTPHSAVVVGSRPAADGSCEYLVRNSYGSSNNGYAWPAERGQVWIDEASLLRNLSATVVIP